MPQCEYRLTVTFTPTHFNRHITDVAYETVYDLGLLTSAPSLEAAILHIRKVRGTRRSGYNLVPATMRRAGHGIYEPRT